MPKKKRKLHRKFFRNKNCSNDKSQKITFFENYLYKIDFLYIDKNKSVKYRKTIEELKSK